jgi:flagellar biosynthesis protein
MTKAPETGSKTPRDVAVALQGDGASTGDPGRIIASGHGSVARQIIEIAAQHGIEIREDADLAEVLAVLETDSPVPAEVMTVVAELLGYVYRVNNEASAGKP